jgi:hypothetical protein
MVSKPTLASLANIMLQDDHATASVLQRQLSELAQRSLANNIHGVSYNQ